MGVYSAGAKEKPFGDLGIGHPLGHQPEHLELARAQATDRKGGISMSSLTNIVREAAGFLDRLIQGKIPSRGPGGYERFLPKSLLGDGERSLVLGAKVRRQGEADSRLDYLRDSKQADGALCAPLGDEAGQTRQDFHSAQLVALAPKIQALMVERRRARLVLSCSPERWSCSLLVVSILRSGQVESNSVRAGAASATCSKLSSNSNSRFSLRYAFKRSSSGRPPASLSPSVLAVVGTTNSGSQIGASETK